MGFCKFDGWVFVVEILNETLVILCSNPISSAASWQKHVCQGVVAKKVNSVVITDKIL